MQHDIPSISIRYTPHDHVAAFTRMIRAAERQIALAQTSEDRLEAMIWKDNAERNLAHWQQRLEDQHV